MKSCETRDLPAPSRTYLDLPGLTWTYLLPLLLYCTQNLEHARSTNADGETLYGNNRILDEVHFVKDSFRLVNPDGHFHTQKYWVDLRKCVGRAVFITCDWMP